MPATEHWTQYHCKLVTPMYGGGVNAAEVDEKMPIRASGIRGQLRFWWRIVAGPFASPEAMFEREAAIWGGVGAASPSASQVAVRVKAKPVQAGQLSAKSQIQGLPAYGLILDPGADPMLLKPGYAFELAVRCASSLTSQQYEEVQTALRWWASFGGAGARTRRGFGAVQISALKPVTPEEVAKYGGRLCVVPSSSNEINAWETSVKKLQRFRQGPNLGRNPGQGNRPGRSRWPEPDTIRRQTHRHARNHAPEHPVDGVYPRAWFGLPIIFHFMGAGEPSDSTLIPDDERDRMASPLILRPYWSGQKWHPAALLLPGWERRAAELRVGFGTGPFRRAWPTDPAQRQRLAQQIKPMAGRGDDPLTAFMDFFEKD
ncbi:type III-B CRISPR module RAMP protein Cmr1 [Thiorhodospira sibirica]|uniref:type III-B CRISPR module RAMP protein Cmr1 n=1 Tax=Thiorhodospira sibirica TaxID=154347 RepID=UPI001FE4EC72|nr:type III-B CRISPR module RAMP protein Cmr1 [Thiorhodospira sibirica]